MLQPRIALRAVQLPFRCLPSVPARRFASVINEKETPPGAASTPAFDSAAAFDPPPTRDESGVLLRTYTPRTPGIRHLRRPVNDHLWKGRPVHKLTFPKRGHAKGGRNNSGRVTVRHMGGGHKRRIRTVDFLRMDPGPQLVERIEYDPGRTAHIALLRNKDTGKLSYIIAADGMRAGEVVQSYMSGIPEDLWKSMGGSVDPGVLAARTAWRGNCLPLHMIPVGTFVFNVGLRVGKGGQLCRSAGTYATVIAKEKELDTSGPEKEEQKTLTAWEKQKQANEKQRQDHLAQHITVRLSSGEVRLIHRDCCATVGVASNPNYHYTQLGKAGRSRWKNIRPTVRGVAMNAMDHPHGGGRGKSKGNVDPKSPWGIPTKSGYKTRPKWKVNKAVVHPRPRNQGQRRRGYN
ncbi:54S ribosomal protein RML2 [Penicillium chermesinum]|uniref:Large ribosomal subunit protein uL2m n=1 Tax=Penicillium chermesinum TaxID=63820 RepID=A0A9W9TC51_9EURO|nr:54S ribosomal protein RML2 [Penicillium chermesinum]KAJ5217322.1 54S ribosomal protein RML2 [Penicillium chermesinum]